MLTSYRFVFLGLWLLGVSFLAYQSSHLSFDNDTWLASDDPRRVAFDMFTAEFQSDEVLVALVALDGSLFDEERWQKHYAFEKDVKAIDGIASIDSPLHSTLVFDTGEALEIRSWQDLYRGGFIKDMATYQRLFHESLYGGRLLSQDERLVVLSLHLESRRLGVERNRIMQALFDVVAMHGLQEDVFYVGEAALKYRLDEATKGGLVRILFFAFLVIVLFLLIILRSWLRALLITIVALAAMISCLGWIVLFGHHMTALSLALPVLVVVIAIADALHIVSRWSAYESLPTTERFNKMVAATWLPCLSASLTSAIGFGAFVVSHIVPLYNFGIDAFFAILWAYPLIVIAMWFGLLVLEGGRKTTTASQTEGSRWQVLVAWLSLHTDGHYARLWRRRFTVGGLALTAGLSLLYTETNFLDVFFSEKSRLRQGFTLVDDELGGSGRVDVVVTTPAVEGYREIDGMMLVQGLVTDFAALDNVSHVESYLLPVEMVHQAFGGSGDLPEDDAQLSQELLFLEFSRSESSKDVLADYVDFNYQKARLSLQTPTLSSRELAPLLATVEETVLRIVDMASVVVTGFGVYIHTLNDYVLRTQAESLFLTLCLIGVLLLVQFGLRLGLVGFATNLMPLGATLGLIAWLGYPYDFATILIASITLGLCVDDTIHFLHHYRSGRHAGLDSRGARQHALQATAIPIAWTSILFCCGLAVLALSELIILQRFSGFTIFGLMMAFFSSLLFLPSLLERFDKN